MGEGRTLPSSGAKVDKIDAFHHTNFGPYATGEFSPGTQETLFPQFNDCSRFVVVAVLEQLEAEDVAYRNRKRRKSACLSCVRGASMRTHCARGSTEGKSISPSCPKYSSKKYFIKISFPNEPTDCSSCLYLLVRSLRDVLLLRHRSRRCRTSYASINPKVTPRQSAI